MPARFYRGPIGSGWDQFGAQIGGAMHNLGQRNEDNRRRTEARGWQVEDREDQQTHSSEEAQKARNAALAAAEMQWKRGLAEKGLGGDLFQMPSVEQAPQPFAGTMGVGQAITGAMQGAMNDPHYGLGQVNAAANSRREEDFQRQIEMAFAPRMGDAVRAGQTRGADDVDVNAAAEPFAHLGPWVQRMLELENQVPQTPQNNSGSAAHLRLQIPSFLTHGAEAMGHPLTEGDRIPGSSLMPGGMPHMYPEAIQRQRAQFIWENFIPETLRMYIAPSDLMTKFGEIYPKPEDGGFDPGKWFTENVTGKVKQSTSLTGDDVTVERLARDYLAAWPAYETDLRSRGANAEQIATLKAQLESLLPQQTNQNRR